MAGLLIFQKGKKPARKKLNSYRIEVRLRKRLTASTKSMARKIKLVALSSDRPDGLVLQAENHLADLPGPVGSLY